MERRPKSKFVTVLQTCLLKGTLDALAPILIISYKIPPKIMFDYLKFTYSVDASPDISP